MIEKEIASNIAAFKALAKKKVLSDQEVRQFKAIQGSIQRLTQLKQFLNSHGYKGIHQRHPKLGTTPLITAIHENNREIFDLLLSHPKIQVNQTDIDHRTPVWWAASRGKLPYLEKLVNKKANLETPDREGKTPLWASIKKGFFNIAAFLVYKITGYSLYENEDYGKTPLHALCATTLPKTEKEMTSLLNVFKKNKIDLNTLDDNGQTPLMVAAAHGNFHIIDWLLKNGTDPCVVDKHGCTFLEMIAEKQRGEILGLLKKHHLNIHWFEDVEKIKRYGHVLGIGTFLKLGHSLGLGGVISVPMQNKKSKGSVPVYTEDWTTESAFQALETEVTKHRVKDKNYNKHFDTIAEALKLTNTLNKDPAIKKNQKIQILLESFLKNKPLLLPVHTPGHGYGVAIYKDKLIFTDRFVPTGKNLHECTAIYNLKTTNPATIKTFLEKIHGRVASHDELLEILKTMIDLDQPLLRMGDSAQTHGTCSYSNPRSNLEGLLCAMAADIPHLSHISTQKLLNAKEYAHSSYRYFLYAGRFRKVQELLSEMHAAEKAHHLSRVNMFYELAESYMRGHNSQTKNDGNDWQNSIELYNGLSARLKAKFRKRNKTLATELEKYLQTHPKAQPPQPPRPKPRNLIFSGNHSIGRSRKEHHWAAHRIIFKKRNGGGESVLPPSNRPIKPKK